MDIEVELIGTDATEHNVLSLQDWILNEQIGGLRVKRKTGSPKDSEMGLDPLTILTIVLGSKAVVELVKSIHVWIQTRNPKLKVIFRRGDKELEVYAENMPDIQGLLDKLLSEFGHIED